MLAPPSAIVSIYVEASKIDETAAIRGYSDVA